MFAAALERGWSARRQPRRRGSNRRVCWACFALLARRPLRRVKARDFSLPLLAQGTRLASRRLASRRLAEADSRLPSHLSAKAKGMDDPCITSPGPHDGNEPLLWRKGAAHVLAGGSLALDSEQARQGDRLPGGPSPGCTAWRSVDVQLHYIGDAGPMSPIALAAPEVGHPITGKPPPAAPGGAVSRWRRRGAGLRLPGHL